MFNFINDYCNLCHERVWEYLCKFQNELCTGYGNDYHSKNAQNLIKQALQCNNVDIHFLTGGTLTNKVAIGHMLKPYEAVIAANTGHINVHETGAIEALGHKVLIADSVNGKLTTEAVDKILKAHQGEHMVKPKMLYLSNSTEVGTIYYLDELQKLADYCHANDLFLYMDGARIGVALTAYLNDVTFADLAKLCDVFTIGGTKNGLMMGEALVVVNDKLKADLRYYIKQLGAMYAKGFITGMQFEALFTDDLFFEIAEAANANASLLRMGFNELKIKEVFPNLTNQIFIEIDNQILAQLKEIALFEVWEEQADKTIIRLVTSYATDPQDISDFLIALSDLLGGRFDE